MRIYRKNLAHGNAAHLAVSIFLSRADRFDLYVLRKDVARGNAAHLAVSIFLSRADRFIFL